MPAGEEQTEIDSAETSSTRKEGLRWTEVLAGATILAISFFLARGGKTPGVLTS
jgi:hypothetical protein